MPRPLLLQRRDRKRWWSLYSIQVVAFVLFTGAWVTWNTHGLRTTSETEFTAFVKLLNETANDLNKKEYTLEADILSKDGNDEDASQLPDDGTISLMSATDESEEEHSDEVMILKESLSENDDTETNNPKDTLDSSLLLPDALKPVTFHGCCPEDAANPYVKVCLTEQACNENSLYPFQTKEQAQLLQKYVPSGKKKKKLRRKCDQANAQLRPPTKWWTTSNTNVSTLQKFPFGCSHLSMAGDSGPYDRALLFPSSQLLFCGIPKAGITAWLQFLRFTVGAKDYQSNPYSKHDARLHYFDKISPTHQEGIWSNYTKAILLREPAERLLSAYLDKVALKQKPQQRGRGGRVRQESNTNTNQDDNKRQSKPVFGYNISFAEFVDYLAMEQVTKTSPEFRGSTGLSWKSDPHWRPQAWSCGLSENIEDFDYIGTLDQAAFHTKTLLQQVGLWETYGKHYRISERGETKGSTAKTWPPPPLKPGETAVGFQQEGTNKNDRHNQNSQSKLAKYYTPQLMKKVREIYWMDFALWDAVKQAEQEGNVSGKHIVKKLNPECN